MEHASYLNEVSGPWKVEFKELSEWRRVAGGNFGSVYSCMYRGQHVAVKQLLTDLEESDDSEEEGDMDIYYQREMATLKEMHHPNIVELIGLTNRGDEIFIITEYVAGGDLRRRLKNPDIDIPWSLRVQMALDMVEALSYLHSKNIIHRDFKSKNLLVAENWKLKACDFGFARKVTEEYMTLCGTDEWMAPEVMLGEPYDKRCDVYSLGMVFVELITRRKPVERPNPGMPYDFAKLRAWTPKECPLDLLEVTVGCSQFYPDNRPSLKSVKATLVGLRDAFAAGDGVETVGSAARGAESSSSSSESSEAADGDDFSSSEDEVDGLKGSVIQTDKQ